MNTDNIFIAQVDKSERARSEPYITFWVQKNHKYASTLETLFRGEYGNILDNTPPVNPRQLNVQTIWCVRSARHGWCRAQILSLDNSYGGYVAAYMTDYGNTEMVSFDQIRSVDALGASSDSLIKLTHLAVKCVLADITPASPEGWCDAALNYVYESFVGHSVPAQNLGPCGNATAMRVFLSNGEYFVKNLIEVGWALPAPSHNAPPTNPYTSLPAPNQFSYQQNQNHPNKQQIAPSYSNLNLAPPAAEPAPASTPRDYYISGELRFNTDYEVYITVVEQGPNKFSLQDRDSEPQLEHIRQLMSQASLRPLTGSMERGTHCIARFSEDGQLYRGLVTTPSPDACQVYYVDYGNKEYVARDRLYQSFPELLEMPVCAIRCSLFGLESLENLPLLNETFQTLVSNKLLKCRLRNRDRMHVVELFEGERSILDVLRDTCAAAAPSKKQFGMFQTLDFPVGAQESVTVCYLEDLDDFYVQLKNYEDDLNVLQKLINSPNTHRTLQSMTDVLQRKGSPCLALFPEDEQWYRGIVTDVSPEMKRVKVQFVDYGNVAEIDARSVKVLNEHLLNLMPAQALRCSLSGLEKAKIPESVRDEFSQLLETESAYPATVKKINTKHHVELKDLTSEQSINQQILDKINGKVSTVAAAPVKVPIPVPELTEVEKVYVTATDKPGFFHAQLERLPTELLDTLQLELLGVYGKAAANAPLLYADVCPHVNDFGVVQWSHDSAFYRVKILDEFVSDVEVVFVDYGNRLKVNRRAVLSPLTSLKKWTLPMFGIACQVNVNPTLDPAVWSGLEDQSLEVRILRRNGDIFQVVPTPNPCNALLERCVTISGISPVKPASSPVKPLNGWNGSSSVPERSSNRSNSDWQSSREEEQSAGRGAVRNHGRSNGNSNEWSQPTQASNDWGGNTSKPQNNDNGGWKQVASEDPWGSSASTTSSTHERSFPSNSRADSYKPRSEHCDRGERGGYQRGGRDGDSYGGRGGSRGSGRDGDSYGGRGGSRGSGRDGDSYGGRGGSRGSGRDGDSYGGRGGSRGGGRGGFRDRNPPPVPQVVYPRPAPILGQVKDVEVVFVTSPAEFYVQLQDAIPQLDALMAELASFYEESTNSKDLNNPQVGMPCACKFLDDEAWYRGSITNVDVDGAEILFVDYGNVQKTPLTDLKALERKFAVLPPQAYKCGLVNVTLTQSEEEKAKFEELTWEKTLKAKFIRRLEAGGYGVRLRVTGEESSVINEAFGMPSTVGVPAPITGFMSWYTPKENETNSVALAWYDHAQQLFLSPPDMDDFEAQVMLPLAEFYIGLDDNELVEDGLFVGQAVVAKYAEDQVYYRAVVKKADKNPEVCFVDYGNASTFTHADIKRILPKFLEHPQQTLACTLRGVVANSEAASDAEKALSEGIWNCTWYKEENGKFVVDLQSERGSLAQLLYEGGFVTPSASIVESLETDTSLTPVYVSHVKSPALFYLQSQAEEDALAALSDQLNEFCQANPQPLEESERAVGPDSILVAGKHPDDELWYRGKILSWDEDQKTAQVHFVDYGDTQSIPACNLCQISPELQAPPPYGLPCSLTSLLEPFMEDWTEEVTQRLHSLAGEGTVVCKALLCPPADGLTQILGLLAEDVNIIDTLLDEGLATLKTFSFAELPALTVECGQVIDSAFIGFVDNPNCFWVQFTHESFEQMAADLAIQGPHLPTIVPEIGTVCVAQYSVDEAWYRVLILRGASGDVATVLVKFVDYGNTEELAQISLRALPSHYALIPSLAVETTLTTSDAAWLPEAQEAFAAMEGQEVRVSVLEEIQSGKFVVQLVDLETEEDVLNTLKAIQACRGVSEDRVVPEAIEEVAQDAQETDMYTQDADLSMIVEAAEEDITAEERLLEEQLRIEEEKADCVVLDEDLDVAEPVEERHLEEQLRIEEEKADCVVLDEDLDVAEPVEERHLEEQLRIDEAKADCVVLDEDLDVAEPVEDSVTKIQTAIEDLKLETEAFTLGIDVGDLKA